MPDQIFYYGGKIQYYPVMANKLYVNKLLHISSGIDRLVDR